MSSQSRRRKNPVIVNYTLYSQVFDNQQCQISCPIHQSLSTTPYTARFSTTNSANYLVQFTKQSLSTTPYTAKSLTINSATPYTAKSLTINSATPYTAKSLTINSATPYTAKSLTINSPKYLVVHSSRNCKLVLGQ